jgi:16S rRNA (cytosine967-C5)-methyltransferase
VKFCDTHILAFLKSWNRASPLDQALSFYFRTHKSLGSHDRKTIGDTIFTLIRWESLFEGLEKSPLRRLPLVGRLNEWLHDPQIPVHARLGLSPFLYSKFKNIFGSDLPAIANVLNGPAPIALRTNLLKTTRDELLALLSQKFPVQPSTKTAAGILLAKREPLFALPEFKQGLFEVQDEGSQMLAELVEAKPGNRVLDYCSGSGGKTLAIAPNMKGKGELYLHDIREGALKEAALRLRRAGVQNAQILPAGHPTLKKLLHKMDWVLVDAPCSGTGTLRRNVDMKWKIDQAMIDRLVEEQRTIFAEAVRYSKGKIVYATCSILPEENEAQVEYFLKTQPVVLEKKIQLLPESGGYDGFFGAVFRKSEIR